MNLHNPSCGVRVVNLMVWNKNLSLGLWVGLACAAGWAGATWWGKSGPNTAERSDPGTAAQDKIGAVGLTAYAIAKTGVLYKPSLSISRSNSKPATKTNLPLASQDAALLFPDKPTKPEASAAKLPIDLPDAVLQIPDPSRAEMLIDQLRHAVPEASQTDRLPPHVPIDRSNDPNASISLGNVTTGSLIQGKALPSDGLGFKILPKTLTRGYFYGTDGLIDAIQSAADVVAEKYPGSTLWVGNLSREVGGDIEPSVSHNSGRDVDLAFYACDLVGEPVDTGRFVRFDADGKSEDYQTQVFFDSKRNWALVRALLTNTSVQVQHIFIADWLKQLLLDYAIRSGEDADLVFRAERVLEEPRDSSPHAEHFHVRLYCELTERLAGCHDFGIRHPWIDDFSQQRDDKLQALIRLYQSGRQEERDYALRQLDLLTVIPDSQVERWESVEDL